MKSLNYVINEHKCNLKKINHLAINEIKIMSSGTSLGYWWTLVKDIIYFIAYGTFMTLLYGNTDIDGLPRLVYLVTALIPWYFISDCLGGGSRAIRKRGGILTKIKFPLTIIPTYDILSIFYKRAASYSILFFILIINGYFLQIEWFLFLYFVFASLIFAIAFNMLISGFVAISKDFTELYSSIVRILFFFVPILWSLDQFADHKIVSLVLAANPLVYILTGIRGSLAYGASFNLSYAIYFWFITFIIFLLGCMVQYRLKTVYADFL